MKTNEERITELEKQLMAQSSAIIMLRETTIEHTELIKKQNQIIRDLIRAQEGKEIE